MKTKFIESLDTVAAALMVILVFIFLGILSTVTIFDLSDGTRQILCEISCISLALAVFIPLTLVSIRESLTK